MTDYALIKALHEEALQEANKRIKDGKLCLKDRDVFISGWVQGARKKISLLGLRERGR